MPLSRAALPALVLGLPLTVSCRVPPEPVFHSDPARDARDVTTVLAKEGHSQNGTTPSGQKECRHNSWATPKDPRKNSSRTPIQSRVAALLAGGVARSVSFLWASAKRLAAGTQSPCVLKVSEQGVCR